MPTKNLLNFLAAPSRVASKLDWKKTMGGSHVLAVDIGKDRIGMALAPHPSSSEPIRTLEPLRLERCTRQPQQQYGTSGIVTTTTTTNTKKQKPRVTLTTSCVARMASIVSDHQVCAILVSWPVQHEGRVGKPCGQVLHTLDALLEESNTIVTKQRPVCLWDDRHQTTAPVDQWGRDPLFGKITPSLKEKTLHLASEEQYQHHDCSSAVAAQVWQDFCHTHWPEISNNKKHSKNMAVMSVVEYKAYESEQRIKAAEAEEEDEWNNVACA